MGKKVKDIEKASDNIVGEKLDEVIEETPQPLPKKSELLQEQIDLEKQYDSGSAALIEETHSVKFGTKGAYDKMVKYIEKDAEFDHSSATGLVLLYSDIKQQKPFTRETDWNGDIMLKTSSCLVLWKTMMTIKGKGFFEARAFLEAIQLLGPDLSKIVNNINDKQAALRGLHNRLNEIYNQLDAGEYENDLTPEQEAEMLQKSKQIIETEEAMKDEVAPQV